MNYIIYDKKTLNYFIEYINSLVLKQPEKFIAITTKKFLNNVDSICTEENKIFFIQKIPDTINIKKLKKHTKCYLINTEQLTIKEQLEKIKMYSKYIQIIDYSYANTKLLKNKSLYLPYQINQLDIHNYEKNLGVAIIGTQSERRTWIYDELKKYLPIDWIIGWGEERDIQLFRYKILLNVHFRTDYNVFEEIRCNRCVFNKMIVISEINIPDKKCKIKNEYVIECEYEKIVGLVIEIYKNYDKYYKKIYGTFNLDELDEYYIKFYEKII